MADGWDKLQFLAQVILGVLPRANAEIRRWEARAAGIPAAALRTQALASLTRKRFHAQGGAMLAALPAPPEHRARVVTLTVALQILVDYLDNLCDRCGPQAAATMRDLHQSAADAVDLRRPLQRYYRSFPTGDDAGYLVALVTECRRQLRGLQGYRGALARDVQIAIQRYCDLQVYKHLPAGERDVAVRSWLEPLCARYPDLAWWELAAATGSTLGIFALCSAAADPLAPERRMAIAGAYFPWVGAVHILLDSLVDQREDLEHRDMNFATYYGNSSVAVRRLGWLQAEARQRVQSLPARPLHELVLAGLMGAYLSDPKVRQQQLAPAVRPLLTAAGGFGWAAYLLCQAGVLER